MNRYTISNKYEKFKSDLTHNFMIQIRNDKYMIIDICFGIISFNENYIKLTLPGCNLIVTGLGLSLSNYNSYGVIIRGEFHSVEYEKRVER